MVLKRVVSVILLLVMLVIGARPVLALHYCSGILHEVGVSYDNTDKSCCETMKMKQQDDGGLCHSDSEEPAGGVEASHDNCCDIEKVELSTDDYQYKHQQFNLNNKLPSLDILWLTFSVLIPADCSNTAKISQYFPPGGFSLLNADLLTYICIFRI